MGSSRLSRRALLKTAALGSAAVITAPYVSGVYAAGCSRLGCWDHWVPGANKALIKLCNDWGEKNKVDVHIDFITSQGEKDKLTAAAEAQAGTGHDIMSHRDWNIRIHQAILEPLDDVIEALIKKYGPISPVAEYLAKIKGVWLGVPTAVGSQVKPCCSRFDLYKQHAGLDLQATCSRRTSRNTTRPRPTNGPGISISSPPRSCTRPAFRLVCRWARPATRSIGSAGCLTPMASFSSTPRTTSRSTRTKRGRRWKWRTKIMEVNPPEVFAWDDAGNNRWLISGKGSGIMNPPSAWAVAKRDNPKVAQNCWTHPVPKGPKGRFVGQLPQFYGLWKFSKNKPAAKDLLHVSFRRRNRSRQLVEASFGYDLPSFKSMYDLDTWKKVEPPVGTVYSYPPRGDEQTSMLGCAGALGSGRPDVQSGDQHRDDLEVHARAKRSSTT